MKKILEIILQPIQSIGKLAVSDKLIAFFDKRRYMIYLIAGLVTLVIVFFVYIYPNLV